MRQPQTLQRPGFTLVEVLVAIVILAVVFMGLAPVLLRGAEQQRRAQADAVRQAALMATASRFLALPFDSISGIAGPLCEDAPGMSEEQEVCVRVDGFGKERTITVVVRPTNEDKELGLREDSLTFVRTRLGSSNPFNL